MKFVSLLRKLFTRREMFSALLVSGLAMLAAVFEAISVISVVPFLSVAADPSVISEGGALAKAYAFSGVDTVTDFVVMLGIASFLIIVSAAGVRTLSEYFVTRFVQQRRHSIATYLLEFYLQQPYEFFITRHSSDVAKEIVSEVDAVIISVIQPTSTLLTSAITLVVLGTMLIVVDPIVAFTAGGALLAVYLLVFRVLKPIVERAGIARRDANAQRFEALSEALSGIKMIKLYGTEKLHLSRFAAPSKRMADAILTSTISGRMPKYIIEAVAMGGIILLALAIILREPGGGASSSSLLPMLGLYGLGGYRMLPAIQGIYLAVTQIRFGIEPLKSVAAEVESAQANRAPELSAAEECAPMQFERQLQFQNVFYKYPTSETFGITDLSLTIPRGSWIGMVGETGAGKTTFMDLFLGLLAPTRGHILCDDVELTEETLPRWRANVGYVPQEILLTNTDIKSNIAFGLKGDNIDLDRVIECAKVAQIHQFICEKLPQGYDTSVGERGIRLSGGQRQRIGIARALYANPPVLVFDEATSALDVMTEERVMAGLREMGKQKTLLIVAHRYTTLKACDQIVHLQNGQIAHIGDYQSILAGFDGKK